MGRHVRAISVLRIVLVIAGLGIAGEAPRGAQEPTLVIVDNPRPLMAAVDVVEERCHCAVTYEDPRWQADQLIDVSSTVSHRPGARVRVPRGGRFDVAFPDDSFAAPFQVDAALEEAVTQYEQQFPGMGVFAVVKDGTAFSVRPRGSSVLDAPVTPPAGARSIGDIVAATLEQAGAASGVHIGLGLAPLNALKMKITMKGDAEPARSVLNQALAAMGRKMSWRLLYDDGMGQYYLSIHAVK